MEMATSFFNLTPGSYKFKCKYKTGIIRVLSNSDEDGTSEVEERAMQLLRKWLRKEKWLQTMKLLLSKVPAFEFVRQHMCKPTQPHSKKKSKKSVMADGINVTMKYKDGTGEVEIPDTDL
ncbi:hypothetical protein GN244_ATG12000 [Phytophthora infestans]|nr:hypothetical protein GN244_ATG12000 [Phytophthora infestans]